MPRSLSIECEWVDQPDAQDPLERATWAGIRISAAGRLVTRFWDRATQSERGSIFVPAFPVAEWIVANWWELLHEPIRSELIPPAELELLASQRAWLHRHCLRAAESGLLLPRACLYSNGPEVCVAWSADEQDAFPHMPGYFIGSGSVAVDRIDLELALREFVASVVDRTQDQGAVRAARLRENLSAIRSADVAEIAFCRAAGRLGLNPYRVDEWDPSLATLLEAAPEDDSDRPLIVDALEAAGPENAVEIWHWAADSQRALELAGAPRLPSLDGLSTTNAAKFGYRAAMALRGEVDGIAPLESPAILAAKHGLAEISFAERDHLSSPAVKAAVGWRAPERAIIAGPAPPRPDSARFLEARGIYLALYACHRGARLITNAHTWDQQASRAFAAELLMPRLAVLDRLGSQSASGEGEEAVRRLAAEYQVSHRVVELQLANSGIELGSD